MEPFKVIVDAITGESTQVPLTKEELDRGKRENDLFAERATEAEAKATAKAALLAKLGITADEAALLLG